MAIEFVELDDNHIAVRCNWGRKIMVTSSTITHTKEKVLFDGQYDISDLEQILSKMKELQGENNDQKIQNTKS